MARSVWDVFLALFGAGPGTGDDSSEEEAEDRFVPSPLDLSVRIGHGGSDDDRVRELSRIREQADELQRNQRDN